MVRFTEGQYQNHMSKMKDEPGETESYLQSKIVYWAHSHGYPCHAHPMTREYIKAHTRGAGWPDVTICLPGRIIFLELKSKKGVMREDQLRVAKEMAYLNCEYYKVKTWKRFIEIVNEG